MHRFLTYKVSHNFQGIHVYSLFPTVDPNNYLHDPCFVVHCWHDDVIKWNLSALLALCAGNSLGNGEFPAQRPVTRSLDIFFDLRLNG